MTNLPPSGSRSVPARARKSASGVSGGFGAALRSGAQNIGNSPDEEQQKPKKAPQVRIAKSTYGNLMATKVLKALGVGFLVIALVYVCFAISIARILPTTTVGLIPVKNITFAGGLVPAGEEIVVDMANPQGTEILDYLKQSFIPNGNAAIVEVAAGPWGSFEWSNGIVTHDEQILNMAMPEEPAKLTLDNEYLVTCVEGACVPGQGYVIHASQLMGEVIQK